MLIFLTIAIAGFLLLAGGALFGHDHDHDGLDHGGLDHGMDHDVGHDHDAGHDHDVDHGNDPVVSIFSTKVIGTFIMGFGASGTIAAFYGLTVVPASLCGLLVGIAMGGAMYGVLRLMYSQQANSLISSTSLVGQTGVVMIAIPKNSVGEIEVSVGDIRLTRHATSVNAKEILKGRRVKVLEAQGSQLIVEETN